MIPASPTTSGREEVFEAMTGVPQAIASSGGRPKPSYKEGKTKSSAALWRAGRPASGKGVAFAYSWLLGEVEAGEGGKKDTNCSGSRMSIPSYSLRPKR